MRETEKPSILGGLEKKNDLNQDIMEDIPDDETCVHNEWTCNLQRDSEVEKVFPVMKIAYAMTWHYETALY